MRECVRASGRVSDCVCVRVHVCVLGHCVTAAGCLRYFTMMDEAVAGEDRTPPGVGVEQQCVSGVLYRPRAASSARPN